MLLFVLVSKVVYAVCCTYVYRAARALEAVYAVCLLLPHILPHIHMYIVLPLPLHLPTSQRAHICRRMRTHILEYEDTYIALRRGIAPALAD